MNLPLWLKSLPTINREIAELEKEQARMTRRLYAPDLTPLERMSIDIREQKLIPEVMRLREEKRKRAAALALRVGFVPGKKENGTL